MLNDMTGSVRQGLIVLLAAVGVLFLAGCVNLANLLLARAANRGQEFSLRVALGATRSRLARQFFAETIPLAVAGALLGVFASHWLLQLLIPLLPASMPRVGEIGFTVPCSLHRSFFPLLRRSSLGSPLPPRCEAIPSADLRAAAAYAVCSSSWRSPARSSCW
jgi:ABC-type antimicrobial peptide transport system permease subunit